MKVNVWNRRLLYPIFAQYFFSIAFQMDLIAWTIVVLTFCVTKRRFSASAICRLNAGQRN